MSDSFERLLKITDTLRGEGGCPWDRRQTPESMRRYIIEEACEVVQAINDGDKTELCEELGDLLFHLHRQLLGSADPHPCILPHFDSPPYPAPSGGKPAHVPPHSGDG